MKLIALLLAVSLLTHCSRRGSDEADSLAAKAPDSAADYKIAEVANIREATFRYQFQKNASGQQQKAAAYFLTFGDDDKSDYPDASFLKRFADVSPPVKSGKDCESSPAKGVVDKVTGQSGLIFHVGAIKWISDTEVEVSGGYYEAGLSASGNTYYLKKKDGKWVVERDKMHWIS